MRFLVSLAARNLTRNGRRSAITLSAIIVGVVVVVVLKGFADGFIHLVVASVVEGRTGALQVHRAGYFVDREALPLNLSITQSPQLEARMSGVAGVKGLSGRIQFGGLVGDGSSQVTFLGTAIDPSAERRACPNWGKDLAPGGADLDPEDFGQGLLGVGLAKSFRAGHLNLSALGPTGRMNAMEISVKGVTETSLRFENKRLITVPLRFAQELLGMRQQVTEYAIAIEKLGDLDRVAADLSASLGPQYEVQTWREVQPYMYGVVKRQEAIVLISAVIFFSVIVIGIANAMASSVLERAREVGTMLAFGMRRSQIVTLFLLEAMMIGTIAGGIGAALGRISVWTIALFGIRVKQIVTPGDALVRPEVSLGFTLAVVIAAASVAVLSAALSALRASRQSPADALRSE